jgi:adenosylcobinamide-phosphate synthase
MNLEALGMLPQSMGAALLGAVALMLAVWLDRLVGEPPARAHPVVWMGQVLRWWGERLAPLSPRAVDWKCFWAAALVWCALAAIVFVVFWGLQWAVLQLHWVLSAALMALLLKPLFAWRMLCDEVLAVEDALARSLPEGRERLARLVSRDVTQLEPLPVRESAI